MSLLKKAKRTLKNKLPYQGMFVEDKERKKFVQNKTILLMSVNKSERSITLKKTLGLFNQTCILINELIYNAENNNKHYLTKTFKQKICKK